MIADSDSALKRAGGACFGMSQVAAWMSRAGNDSGMDATGLDFDGIYPILWIFDVGWDVSHQHTNGPG
jgi:hypothetical protein